MEGVVWQEELVAVETEPAAMGAEDVAEHWAMEWEATSGGYLGMDAMVAEVNPGRVLVGVAGGMKAGAVKAWGTEVWMDVAKGAEAATTRGIGLAASQMQDSMAAAGGTAVGKQLRRQAVKVQEVRD